MNVNHSTEFNNQGKNIVLGRIGTLEFPHIWQYTIAIDVQYNSIRNFDAHLKNLYIKRRNQLFRILSKSKLDSFRFKYLKLRYSILASKYGSKREQKAKLSHVRSSSDTSFLSFIYDDLVTSPHQKRIPTESLTPNDLLFDEGIPTQLNLNSAFCDNFQFNGVYHIFDQHHKEAVNDVKFANNDNSLLCSASSDATLSICQLTPSPPTILFVLRGHTDSVSAFEWSRSNDLIVSCSRDATLRLWSTKNGNCLRTFRDQENASLLTCSFHPKNNNMIFTGNCHGKLNIINLSTGLSVIQYPVYNQKVSLCSLCFQSDGDLIFVGDSKGIISTFSFNIDNCTLKSIHKVIIVTGCPITSLSTLFHNSEDFILANCACNAIVLLKCLKGKQIDFIKSFPVNHTNPNIFIKSIFCPSAINNNKKMSIVTGSEDTNIYFYTFDDHKKTRCVNKLQGHSFPVLDVCFNHDESLLASGDSNGNIIVWKRNEIK